MRGVEIAEPHKLHCFIDRRLALGYIAWIGSGVGVVQVGLARRFPGDQSIAGAEMAAFLEDECREPRRVRYHGASAY